MKKIISIIGARPQFIKLSSLARQISKKHRHLILHTGQHYDYVMSKIFFNQLKIAKPDYNLNIGSSNHGEQTGLMLKEIEKILLKEKPDLVIVYGDTNSTLAGALAAAKLHIPIAHVEAGMRSFNRTMPEEINRVMTDHLADIHLSSTDTAVRNLKNEGIKENVRLVGDIMIDSLLQTAPQINKIKNQLLKRNQINPKKYVLVTIHRAANTDNKERLKSIVNALQKISIPVIFPAHLRTIKYLKKYKLLNNLEKAQKVVLVKPLGYLEMLWLEKNAACIVTDSGGVQKEAFHFKVPCITLRSETEWVETVTSKWNTLLDQNVSRLPKIIETVKRPKKYTHFYGKGKAGKKINHILNSYLKNHS